MPYMKRMIRFRSDKNRAEAARIRAEERLQHQQSMHEYYQSKIALDRAMQRLQAAAKYRR